MSDVRQTDRGTPPGEVRPADHSARPVPDRHGANEANARVRQTRGAGRETSPTRSMVLLGALTIPSPSPSPPGRSGAAALYAAYGLAGPSGHAFVCPYCATTAPPAVRVAMGCRGSAGPKGRHDCSLRSFKRHIPVIVPLWLLPVGFGVWAASPAFSWSLVGLVGLFVVTRTWCCRSCRNRHSCTDFPQASDCPWMGPGGTGSRLRLVPRRNRRRSPPARPPV